ATGGEQPATAVRLAEVELASRQDVFTWDARAWSLAAQGRWAQAGQDMHRALSEGTQDARLFLHAGIIAAETEDETAKGRFLNNAKAIEQMLLPSERLLLAKYLKAGSRRREEAEARPLQ